MAMTAVVAVSAGACRSHTSAPSAEVVGIGFDLTDDSRVARGAIVTQPAGREELFLPFVAGGSPRWAAACERERGDSPVLFSFRTDATGRVQSVPAAAHVSARARCIAGQVTSSAPMPLASDTLVKVRLALKAAP